MCGISGLFLPVHKGLDVLNGGKDVAELKEGALASHHISHLKFDHA